MYNIKCKYFRCWFLNLIFDSLISLMQDFFSSHFLGIIFGLFASNVMCAITFIETLLHTLYEQTVVNVLLAEHMRHLKTKIQFQLLNLDQTHQNLSYSSLISLFN